MPISQDNIIEGKLMKRDHEREIIGKFKIIGK